MVATLREYQGTIASQVRVHAIDRKDADNKLHELGKMLGDGAVVDEWSVPLIRDMVLESDAAPKASFRVTVAFDVEAPSDDTATCTAMEMSSTALGYSHAIAGLARLQAEAAVRVPTQAIARTFAERGRDMVQGRIADYHIQSVERRR